MLACSFGSQAGGREMQTQFQDMLPVLVEKTGETNTRIKEAANELLVFLGEQADLGPRYLEGAVCRPVKNQTAWKPVLARLQLIETLMGKFGIARGHGDGISVDALMGFLALSLTSTSGEVRALSVKLVQEITNVAGAQAVGRFLPKDLNPKIREELDRLLVGGADSRPAAPPPSKAPPAAARAAPAKAAAPSPARGAAGGRGPAAKSSPAPVRVRRLGLHPFFPPWQRLSHEASCCCSRTLALPCPVCCRRRRPPPRRRPQTTPAWTTTRHRMRPSCSGGEGLSTRTCLLGPSSCANADNGGAGFALCPSMQGAAAGPEPP